MIEPKTDVQEDEYQFDDFDKMDMSHESVAADDGQAAPTHESTNFSGVAEKKDYRKIVILGLIVVLVLGFAIHSLVGHLDSVKIPKEQASLPQVSNNMQQPTNVPSASASANVAPAPVALAPSPPSPPAATESEIDQLNTTLAAQQQTIDQMQNSMNTMQESVGTLNATINDLSQKLTDAMNKMPEKRVKPIAKPVAVEQPPRPTYTIRALVPGRAWLQASDGQTMTVVNGDQVPAYGSVQDIDLNAGQVILTDGTIIGYNFNG